MYVYVYVYVCMCARLLKLYLILYIINEILIMLLANLAYNSQIYINIYIIFESLLTLSKFFFKLIKDFLFISLRSMLYLILKALYI